MKDLDPTGSKSLFKISEPNGSAKTETETDAPTCKFVKKEEFVSQLENQSRLALSFDF